MRRKSFNDSPCAIARTLDVIGDWWTLLILRDAFEGVRRFNDFQRSLEVPKNVLSTRLKTLVESGILEAVPASDGSAYHEYILTPRGLDLFPVLVALRQWGEAHLFRGRQKPQATLVDRKKQRPVKELQLRSEDGRLLAREDTEVTYDKVA